MNFRILLNVAFLAMTFAGVTPTLVDAQTSSKSARTEGEMVERLKTIPDAYVISTTLSSMTGQLRYAEDKRAILAEVSTLNEPVRNLFWMTYMLDETPSGQMHTFFTKEAETERLIADTRKLLMEGGKSAAEADEGLALLRTMNDKANPIGHAAAVADALAKAGFARQLEAFRSARALAADNPGADFTALDAAFGSKSDVNALISAYVTRTPALVEWLADARKNLSEEDRFQYLAGRLYGLEDSDLEGLKKAYRQIFVVYYFNAEMLNGSVHQFFYNSSGQYAPDVVVAMRDMGLPKHADAVQRGIDMFKQPYPIDTQKRRELYFSEDWAEWDDKLAELTGDVDDGEITPALIALAKKENILPQ